MPSRPSRRRGLRRIASLPGRGTILIVTVGLVALVVGFSAFAYWASAGLGSSTGSTGDLHAPTDVAVPATSTGTVHVSWTGSSTGGAAIAPQGYYAERFDGSSWWAACGSSPSTPVAWPGTSCDDASVADGSYTYRVTAVLRSWTARSSSSGTVVVNSDTTPPVVQVSFPANLGAYNATGWAAGSISGSVVEAASGIAGASSISLTITQSGTGLTWNGSAFASGSNTVPATSYDVFAGTWTYAFPAANFPANGTYTVVARAIDRAGNTGASSATTFTYDTVAPADSISLAASPAPVGAYVSGSTVFFNTNAAGGLTFVNTVTDAVSGPASAVFTGIADWSGCNATITVTTPAGGPYPDSPCSWAPGAASPAAHTFSSVDKAGNTSAGQTLTFVNDNAAPTGGSIGYVDGVYSAASVAVTTASGTDGTGSGVNPASGIVKRDSAPLTNDTCGAFPGTYSTTVTLVLGTDVGVTSGNCYRYEYLVSDNVGNQALYTSTNVARIASGPATKLVLAAATTTPTAGAGDNVTITAKDSSGNTITSYTGSHALTFGGASSIGAFNPTVTNASGTAIAFGSATAITFANGVASVSGANNGKMTLVKAETVSITVGDGTINNSSGTLAVTVSPAAPSTVTKTAGDAQSAVVSTAFTTALKVTVKDAYGNTQPAGVSVTFAAPASGASGVFTAAGCNGQPPRSVCIVPTASDGTATATTLTANATAGAGYSVSATAAGGSNPTASFYETNAAGGTKTWIGGSSTWCTAANWSPSGIPGVSDNVSITTVGTVTIQSGCAAQANSLTLGNATGTASTLTFASATSTLAVGGDVTIVGPTSAATRDLQVNAGTLTVGGNLSLGTGQAGIPGDRVTSVTVTTGIVTVGGNLTFENVAGSSPLQTQIVMSGGAGTFNLGGAFTINNGAGTLAAGSTSTFNFNGTTAQTIPIGVGNVVYNNLSVNSSGTATLGAAISPTNVLGNVTVGSGTFDNGGYAIVGNAAKTFAVGSADTFRLSGTSSAFPSGFGTVSLAASSTVNYAGSGAQTVVAQNYGNLTSSSTGARTLAGSGTVGIAGVFTPGSNAYTVTGSTVDFNGTSAQTVPAFTYNNLGFDNTSLGGVSLGVAVSAANVLGNVAVGSGTFDNGGLAIVGNAGASFQVAAGATFRLSGVSSAFPSGFGTVSLAASSTVNYAGSGAQVVVAQGYGNLTSSSTGARTLAGSGTVGIAGVFTPGSNAYTVTGSIVDFNGTSAQTVPAFTYDNLTLSGARTTNSVTLANGGSIGVAGTFAPTATFTSGAYVVTGSTVDFNGTGAQTVPAFSFNTLTLSGARTTNSVTLANAGTIRVAGTFAPAATFTTGAYVVTGSTVDFNGTVAQTVPAFTYNNLGLDNTGVGGVALGVAISAANVLGNVAVGSGTFDNGGYAIVGNAGASFQVAAGATFRLSGVSSAFPSGFGTVSLAASSTVNYAGTGAQTVVAQNYGNLTSSSTGARTLAGSGTVGIAGVFTPGSNAYTVTGSTVDFNGTSAQTVPVGASATYDNLSFDNAAGATLTNAITATNVIGNVTVGSGTFDNGGLAIVGNAAKTFAVGSADTFKLSGTTSAFPTGFGTVSLDPASTVNYAGTGAQTVVAQSYGNLTSSSTGARTLAGSGTVAIAGVFTPGTNVYTTTGSTVDFNGTVAQTVPIGLGNLSYYNLSLDNTSAGGAKPSAAMSATNVTGNVTVGSGTFDNGGFAIVGSAAKTFAVGSADTFRLSGTTSAFPTGFGTVSLDPASTVNYAGTGAQTVVAQSYGNLTSSSTGARTLAGSGTVGVAGVFTPGTNVYTVTGSTVDFNGSSAQTVPAFNFNNLTSSSTGARTLAGSGTIGIAGAFTPGANAFTTSGSTVNFNATGAQSVPAFAFNNLTVSGARTTNSVTFPNGGTVGIGGTYSRTATFTTGGFVLTGNTVDFNGTGAQTVPVAALASYNNLILDNPSGATLANAITATNVIGNVTVGSGTFDNGGLAIVGNAAKAFQVAAGATFRLSGTTSAFPSGFGTTTLDPTSTVTYTGTGAQTIAAAPAYGNLGTGGAGTKTAGGALTVNGNLSIGAGTTFAASTFAHALKGNFSNGGTFTTGAGSTVTFSGTSPQTISGPTATTFVNLTIANSVSLNGVDATASGTLALGSNVLSTGANKMIVTATAPTRTTGFVNGGLQRTASVATLTFDVGNGALYTPVSVVFTTGSTGTLTVRSTAGEHPQVASSGINSSKDVNSYWTLASTGTVNFGTVTFNYPSGNVDALVTPATFQVKRWNGTAWSGVTVSGTPTLTQTAVSGLTSAALGDFVIGNP